MTTFIRQRRWLLKKTTGEKEIKRYTIKDSQNAFACVGESLQELDQHIEDLKSRDQAIQPFLLILGDKNFGKLTETK